MLTRHDLYFFLGILGRDVDVDRLVAACLTAARRPDQDLPELLLRQEVCDRPLIDAVLAGLEGSLERHGWQEDAALAEQVESAGPVRIMAAWEAAASALAGVEPADLAKQRYTGGQLHGQGGLGRVWKTNDSRMRRVVALKEVRPELAGQPAVRQRFVQEARITAQLEHPNIMPVYDLHEDGSRTFYTMRFIPGQTLHDAIERFHQGTPDWSSLEFRQLLRVFLVICEAVSFAHGRGVLHRDLKPANIALGDCGDILLFDWGLAQCFGAHEAGASIGQVSDRPDQSQAGKVVGTPAFMPPEQARGDLDLGPASDVYGLGAILFNILTGQPPHVSQEGEATEQLLRRIVAAPTPLARTLRADVPRALEAVCARAMAEKPAARYASAADLAREIERWLAGQAVEALPDRWHQRLGRWLRRHPLLTQAAASFLLLLIVTASVIAALTFAARATLAKLDRIHMEQETRDLDEMFERRIQVLHNSTRFYSRLPVVPVLIRNPTPPAQARQGALSMIGTVFEMHPEYVSIGLVRPDPWTWVLHRLREPGDAPGIEGKPVANPQLQAFFDRCAANTTPAVTEAIITDEQGDHPQLWLGLAVRDQEHALGVVALSVDLRALFRLEKEPEHSDRGVFVTDAAGQVIDQPAARHAALTGSITARFPILASHLADVSNNRDFHYYEAPGRALGCRRLFADASASSLKLILVVERPVGLETARAARTREWLLAFTACLIVAALAVIYVMFRLLARRPIAVGA